MKAALFDARAAMEFDTDATLGMQARNLINECRGLLKQEGETDEALLMAPLPSTSSTAKYVPKAPEHKPAEPFGEPFLISLPPDRHLVKHEL